jgi:hypothetical protein
MALTGVPILPAAGMSDPGTDHKAQKRGGIPRNWPIKR